MMPSVRAVLPIPFQVCVGECKIPADALNEFNQHLIFTEPAILHADGVSASD